MCGWSGRADRAVYIPSMPLGAMGAHRFADMYGSRFLQSLVKPFPRCHRTRPANGGPTSSIGARTLQPVLLGDNRTWAGECSRL
jgi:hypothetical protein